VHRIARYALIKDNPIPSILLDQAYFYLFVCIDSRFYAPWYAINEGKPSGSPMLLPKEVDIVWAVASTRSSALYAVWQAERDQPWNVLEPVKVT